ncbi:helix-turn-helix domain-containing protein [Algoriphagus sediminis]|uniref:Helix-turn-helix transcriptional regulator n=1 Tax=Algoriphagus sediminis TaxID=3057113 RepID=A0ABT7Y852_9BACT|nr:helix-turn-helix transcriptional regulator [Algoriphagus sediminis]MDN3202635.1 helix-turn-helix transcriptional regulator [Algoriphagus sediminis]
MKQPKLGKRISELRKAKGWTQEELVEKCNLNVRTIQRIEAGEVTPRSYTVKALFEALGVEWSDQDEKSEASLDLGSSKKWIMSGFVGGIIYFILSFFEIAMDAEIMEGIGFYTEGYIPVKLAVLVFYSLFLFGYIHIAKVIPNNVLAIGAWVLLGLNASWITVDIISFTASPFLLEDYFVVKLISVGLGFILFGFGFLQYKNLWSNVAMILGVLAIITGVLFVTVIGTVIGLITFTLFEIGQLAFMVWLVNDGGRKSPSAFALNH